VPGLCCIAPGDLIDPCARLGQPHGGGAVGQRRSESCPAQPDVQPVADRIDRAQVGFGHRGRQRAGEPLGDGARRRRRGRGGGEAQIIVARVRGIERRVDRAHACGVEHHDLDAQVLAVIVIRAVVSAGLQFAGEGVGCRAVAPPQARTLPRRDAVGVPDAQHKLHHFALVGVAPRFLRDVRLGEVVAVRHIDARTQPAVILAVRVVQIKPGHDLVGRAVEEDPQAAGYSERTGCRARYLRIAWMTSLILIPYTSPQRRGNSFIRRNIASSCIAGSVMYALTTSARFSHSSKLKG
jgi:hypothetical protein